MRYIKGMSFRLQSPDFLRFIQASGASAALLLAGCNDPKPKALEPVPEPRQEPAVSESVPLSEPARDPVQPKPSATPQPQSSVDPATSDPAVLAKQFRATAEPDKRGELVDELWGLDSPAAVETLRQLFLTERELDVKVNIVAGLSDSKKPETREGRFGLVVSALAPGQPKDVRELAAQMLVDFDDPRAVSLLQQFAQDADPDMREAAQEALETRKAVEQP
jgi:hypothetical protein